VTLSVTGNPIYSLGISEGGSKLVIDDKDNFMSVWNTDTMIQTFQTNDVEAHAENMWTKSLLSSSTDKYLRKVAISPDGTKIATAHGDHQLHMWVAGKVSWTMELPASCCALTFNPADTQLVVDRGRDRVHE
jgi:WD40 repeat protein